MLEGPMQDTKVATLTNPIILDMTKILGGASDGQVKVAVGSKQVGMRLATP